MNLINEKRGPISNFWAKWSNHPAWFQGFKVVISSAILKQDLSSSVVVRWFNTRMPNIYISLGTYVIESYCYKYSPLVHLAINISLIKLHI